MAEAPLNFDPKDLDTDLGPLKKLIGTWVGRDGFNILAVPDRSNPGKAFKILHQRINETITFQPIGGQVPNRGISEIQKISGLFYQWQVADSDTNSALHFENGMILVLNMNPDRPDMPGRVARLSSIPHGNTVLSIGNFINAGANKPPFDNTEAIPAMDAFPIGDAGGLGYADPYVALEQKLGLDFRNLNHLLKEQLDQELQGGPKKKTGDAPDVTYTFEENLVLDQMTTEPKGGGGGIDNIPFIIKNTDTTKMVSTFWIETLKGSNGSTRELLQYNQDISLEFFPNNNPGFPNKKIIWPHIDVNTLVKQ